MGTVKNEHGTIETIKYLRRPLYVDAVQVTRENMAIVALWCEGQIVNPEVTPSSNVGKAYIDVRVHNPRNQRQTKAYPGDWVLHTPRGFKVYPDKPFQASFAPPVSVVDMD